MVRSGCYPVSCVCVCLRYIFPGVGLGAIVSGARTLNDDDFTVAAQCLASQVSAERLAQGCAYPPIKDIREVSVQIAAAVAESVLRDGRADPAVLGAAVATYMQ